ncbi:hypothetical protein [Polaribacter aestuariivivens]|uniref:hypothetical protein n=1 Tax=Polaribacter aestuariivivens TaxID=2304626 RepID=UPI003F49A51A
MNFRFFLFQILIISFCISCDKFSFKKNKQIQEIDTIVNFSSVDTYPSFKVCDSLIAKKAQENCFRNTIHATIGAKLQEHKFTIRDSISEIIYVDLLIDANGKITLKEIESSKNIQTQLPKLDSVLRISVESIPTIFPAIKRGIPVTTKYKLPIKIELKE